MNFLVLIVLIALAVGVGGGFLVHLDPGYVRISWWNWLIETNIWIALLLLVGFYFLFHYTYRALVAAFAVRAGYSSWLSTVHQRRAQRYTQRGLVEFAEGNYKKAQKHLSNAASSSEAPLINYLAAAQAANALGNDKEREKLLQRAYEKAPEGEMAVGLARAQMQLGRGENEEALATLLKLRQKQPLHPAVLRHLKSACMRLNDWHRLRELLPDLERSKALSSESLLSVQEKTWSELMRETAAKSVTQPDGDNPTGALNALWDSLPNPMRKSGKVVEAYVSGLLSLGATGHAGKILTKTLRQTWDSTLLEALGKLALEDVSATLEQAEGWLRDHPEDPVLLRALGRLAIRNNTWDRARQYLEKSYQLDPATDTALELGRLFTLRGELEEANRYLQQGLEAALLSA